MSSRLAVSKLQRRCTVTRSFSTLPSDFFDVLIVGGGAVGCTLAHQLNTKLPALKIGLMEARDPPKPPSGDDRIPSPRSYALSPNSLSLLDDDQVRSKLPLGYYDYMQVWQAKSPASITFTTDDLDPVNGQTAPFLGACVEDGPLVSALWQALQDKTHCWTNTTLKSVESVGDSRQLVKVTTRDGESINAAVLVGADGANSWVRGEMGVGRTGIEYDHHALTFTVTLENDMRKRAFQRYLDDGGPMALLPTYSPNHAVVVWSTSGETVKHWKEAPVEELVQHLNSQLSRGTEQLPPLIEGPCSSSFLSKLAFEAEQVIGTVQYGLAMSSHYPIPKFAVPPTITEIVSPKFSFPLSCYHTQAYVKNRVALVGDAAHTVHPMAGQGLNLGMSDIQILVDKLQKANLSGMDLSTFLYEYENNRKRNVSLSLGGIHTLQQIFASNSVPLKHAKTFGMNVIQNVGPLRRQLAMTAAHGLSL